MTKILCITNGEYLKFYTKPDFNFPEEEVIENVIEAWPEEFPNKAVEDVIYNLLNKSTGMDWCKGNNIEPSHKFNILEFEIIYD